MSDDAVAARRAEVVSLLESRKAERAAVRDARRSATASVNAADGGSQDVAASSDEFWALFLRSAKALRTDMDASTAAATAPPPVAGSSVAAPPSEAAAGALWATWSARAGELQALVNDSTRFLPPFDVRKAQGAIADLLTHADACRALITPRKKFAFKSRQAGGGAGGAAAPPPPPAVDVASSLPRVTGGTLSMGVITDTTTICTACGAKCFVSSGTLPAARSVDAAAASLSLSCAACSAHPVSSMATSSGGTTAQAAAASVPPAPHDVSTLRDGTSVDEDEHTIQDLEGVTIIIAQGQFSGPARVELTRLDAEVSALVAEGSPIPPALAATRRRAAAAASGKDLRLLRLTRCTILLLDDMKALRCDDLLHCSVIASPIAGSVLIHSSRHCTLSLAARQFRIHTSHHTAFFLHALSRPIIEHCADVTFAPYAIAPMDLVRAGLDKPSRHDLWCAVDDFGWHRRQHSPNWRVLSGGECTDAVAGRGAWGEGRAPLLPPAAVAAGLRVDVERLGAGVHPQAAEATSAGPCAGAVDDEL